MGTRATAIPLLAAMLAIAGCADQTRDDWDHDCQDASQAVGMLVVATVVAVPIVLATAGHGGGHHGGHDSHDDHDRGRWEPTSATGAPPSTP